MNKKLLKLLIKEARKEAALDHCFTVREWLSNLAEDWADDLLNFVDDPRISSSNNDWVVKKKNYK